MAATDFNPFPKTDCTEGSAGAGDKRPVNPDKNSVSACVCLNESTCNQHHRCH